jgi:hypothetical protein
MALGIDDEWQKFIASGYKEDDDDDENEILTNSSEETIGEIISANVETELLNPPEATNIYISTKTKIAYLNTPIDLKNIFWQIPIISYAMPINGIVKKQMKFNSLDIADLNFIQEKLKEETCVEEHIITHIDNPSGRIKFKDTRKVSIGISKKDILSYRCKKKSAFYNCFVMILRTKIGDTFKEFHVKVFNTGKLEIPGVQSETTFLLILQQVLETLQQYVGSSLCYNEESCETVLINSNFNCGFYINRESLYDILKSKYNIQTIYDPCSYPGIQCKFYYNPDISIQNGCQITEENKHMYNNIKEVSFMIFRTGSVLIVGRCDENVLLIIYEFLKIILRNEYIHIFQKGVKVVEPVKDKKVRRKNITIEVQV